MWMRRFIPVPEPDAPFVAMSWVDGFLRVPPHRTAPGFVDMEVSVSTYLSNCSASHGKGLLLRYGGYTMLVSSCAVFRLSIIIVIIVLVRHVDGVNYQPRLRRNYLDYAKVQWTQSINRCIQHENGHIILGLGILRVRYMDSLPK